MAVTRSAPLQTVNLPGGGTVTVRRTVAAQAILAEVWPEEDGDVRAASLGMYRLAGRLGDLLRAGAIVEWSGVVDERGAPAPLRADTLDGLEVEDAVAVATGIVLTFSQPDMRAEAAAEVGLDPTAPEVVPAR